MQEILKMVIEPYPFSPEGWRVHFKPILGFKPKEEANVPLVLDRKTLFFLDRKVFDNMKKRFPKLNFGTDSDEKYLFVSMGVRPRQMEIIHNAMQHAYLRCLKNEIKAVR